MIWADVTNSFANLVLNGLMICLLQPRAQDDIVINMTHEAQLWRRRICRVVSEGELRY